MILFIGNNNDTPIANQLGYKLCVWNEEENADYQIYDFIKNIINNETDGIIINAGNPTNNYLGVRIALYIYITQIEDKNIPIVLIANKTKEDLQKTVSEQNPNENIVGFFDSIYLVKQKYDKDNKPSYLVEITRIINNQSHTATKRDSLNNITIRSLEKGESHHSFTNQWGMWKLAQATGHIEKLLEDESFSMIYKTLYFQYLIAKDTEGENSTKQTIDGKSAKILLIDDDAEKGWSCVMNEIFTNCSFTHVSTNTENFIEEAKRKIIEFEADVVLLDVRLTSEDSLSSTETNQLSGTQLLEETKEKNKGIQVIIFTASNKAWNMKALLETGANGYYIKQSPDSYYGENYAIENFTDFQKEIQIAIERASFLKWFWQHTQELILHLDSEYSHESINNNFVESAKLSLNYAYDTIENYNSSNSANQKFLNYAFVAYCNLIEFIITELSESVPSGSKNYYLKATNHHLQEKIIINTNLGDGNPVYQTLLEFKEKQLNSDKEIIAYPYYKLNSSENRQKIVEFTQNKRLKILAGYAAILLLRYNPFSHQDVQDYETLKEKRHKFMHSNENQSNNISLADCKNMFRMAYAVLKGEKIEE